MYSDDIILNPESDGEIIQESAAEEWVKVIWNKA